MVVVEIRISDELRKDLKTEIKEAILSSPLIKRLTSKTLDINKELKAAREGGEGLRVSLTPQYWDKKREKVQKEYRRIMKSQRSLKEARIASKRDS